MQSSRGFPGGAPRRSPVRRWAAGLILFAGVLAVPALGGDAQNDFDPDASFSRYKTYSFVKLAEQSLQGVLKNPETRERVKNFISGVMETRGLREVPRDEAHDLDVRYWLALRQKQDVQTISMPLDAWGGYPLYWTGAWSWYYEEYVIRNYVQGTLLIDIIDPTTKDLVWRTYLRQNIEDRAKAYKEAKKTLNKAFAVFPPSNDEKEKMRKQRAKLEAKYK